MPPLSLSYVLLTYNQTDTVGAAVRSALSQDVEPMEIVISDDCSADGTYAKVEAEVAGYEGPHRIILNRNSKNLGLAGNLHRAHELSSGDVIIAAAGDDISYPLRSRRILETFQTKNPLLVCSYAKVISPNGSPLTGNFRTALFYKGGWNPKDAARSKSLYIGATGAWHRSLYTEYGAIDPEAYEDLVLGFRASLENRVATIREELVQYRLGTGITSSDMYLADVAAIERRQINALRALEAIMRQRIKDATYFGLDEKSEVIRTLKRELVKAALGLSYHEATPTNFYRNLLAHPLLGLHIWHSERRRKRKMLRHLENTGTFGDG